VVAPTPPGGAFAHLLALVEGLFAPRTRIPAEHALTARLLNGLLLASFPTLFVIVLLRLVLGVTLADPANLTLIALAVADLLAALILRSGGVLLSGVVFTFALAAAGVALTWTHYGLRDAVALFPLFAVLVAFFASLWRTGIVLTVLSLGSVWLLVGRDLRGLRNLSPATSPIEEGSIITIMFVLASVLSLVFGLVLRRVVTRALAAQEALRRSERELASILQSTPDIIYRLDTGGRITYVNDAVRRYGYVPLEIAGMPLLELVHPEDREMARGHLDERRMGERRATELEIRLLTARGRERAAESGTVELSDQAIFLLNADPLFEKDGSGPGRCVGSQGVARDITDRKQVEEALRKSEEKYSKVFRAAPAGVVIATLEGERILDVNEEFETMVGYSREELIGRRGLGLGLWADPGEREHIVGLLARGEAARDLEVRWRTRNGALRIERCNSQLIDVDGAACLISAVEDVTDRKRAQEAVRHSEDKYSKVFQAVPAGIAVATLDGAAFLDVNEEFERVFGYRREEIRSRSSLEIGLWQDPGERAHITGLLKEGRAAKDLEVHGRTKGGDMRIVRYNAQKMEIDGVAYMLSALVDVTDHKRLEAQLQQSHKLEAVGRLAGGIAHDFNNMLAVILGQAELVLEALLPTSPLRENVQEIQRAAERSAEVTRQLLTFARKRDAVPRARDLAQAIPERLGMLRRMVGENVSLKWNPSEHLWSVRIDDAQLDQVLINLAVNARDAIQDVGTLEFSAENCEREGALPGDAGRGRVGQWVLLKVSDTGAGMSDQTAAHLFEPFFTTKEVGKGTGMGLATVYGIVQQGGGWIEVESRLDVGTTFRIYLPRAEDAAPAAASTEEPQLPRGRETILVVEDETAIIRLIETSLRQLGYTVLGAGSPREALALAAGHTGPVDLLLTDVVMPEMNGRDLATRLAASRPGIKAVFMSGYTAEVFASTGKGRDGFSFLQKPFTVRQLSSTVRGALEPDRGGDTEEGAADNPPGPGNTLP